MIVLAPFRRTANGRQAAFREALNAEWTKILTVRSTFWTLLTGTVLSIGLAVAMAYAMVSDANRLSPVSRTQFDSAAYGLVGVHLGMVAFSVLGVLAITGEYASGTIRVSLAATPRRMDFLAAKITVLAALVLAVGELVAVSSFLLSQTIYATAGLGASLRDPAMVRAVLGGGIYLALTSLFGLGVGTILRRTSQAVTTVLGILFVLPVVGAFLPGEWGKVVNQLLPTNAGGAIMSAKTTGASLSPWLGIAIFAIYTAGTLTAGILLLEKRDA